MQGKERLILLKENAKAASNVKWLFVKSVIRTAQSGITSPSEHHL